MISTPSEAMGYQASADYSSRLNSPQPIPISPPKSRLSRPGSQSYAESPLRQSFSAHDSSRAGQLHESEALEDSYHMRPPPRQRDKYGGAGYDPPTQDLGPHGGNAEEEGGWVHEQGEGTPILASDEIAKHPGAEYLQPAVSPAQQLAEDDYYTPDIEHHHAHHHSRTGSRSRSRPTSMHSHTPLSRLVSHDYEGTGTPLEEIEEYEPLFTDDDEDTGKKKVITAAEKLRRIEMQKRRFPSQDIWEDAPTSLQLQTTVETPQETVQKLTLPQSAKASTTFEAPDKEMARKGEITEAERPYFLADPTTGFAKPKFRADVEQEKRGRPVITNRFPSRDIWEDTPDSLRLETTVGGNEAQKMPSSGNGKSSVVTSTSDRPDVTSRPRQSDGQPVPVVPARPGQKSQAQPPAEYPTGLAITKDTSPVDKKVPTIPDRPKPQVPPRPARGSPGESSDSKATDFTTKTKPAVPARPQPGSSKFASIKAGFMNDLASRLQSGPQAPPKPQVTERAEQKEEDKGPLSDARKGRARGPARRKPASSPSTEESKATPSLLFSIAKPQTLWSVDPMGTGLVDVPATTPSPSLGGGGAPITPTAQQIQENPFASPLARNTAGESLQPSSSTPKIFAGALAHPSSTSMDARARKEEEAARQGLQKFEEQRIGHAGDVPEPVIDDTVTPPKSSLNLKQQADSSKAQEDPTVRAALETSGAEEKQDTGAPLEPQLSLHSMHRGEEKNADVTSAGIMAEAGEAGPEKVLVEDQKMKMSHEDSLDKAGPPESSSVEKT